MRKSSFDHIVLFKKKFIPNPHQQEEEEEEEVKRLPLLDLSATAAGKKEDRAGPRFPANDASWKCARTW